jgi:uncharacterized protein YcfJ
MNKKTLSIAAAILALSTTAYADNYKRGSNQTHYKYAKVVDVEPIHQNIRYYEPTRDCHYERRATRGNNTTAVIVGSLLGGAIGNELGHKKSNKRVGALAGAILGGSIANDMTRGKRSSYGEQEQVCTTTQQLRYHDKIIGYNVGYRYRGQTYYTRMDHHPSDKIKIAVSVRPVI